MQLDISSLPYSPVYKTHSCTRRSPRLPLRTLQQGSTGVMVNPRLGVKRCVLHTVIHGTFLVDAQNKTKRLNRCFVQRVVYDWFIFSIFHIESVKISLLQQLYQFTVCCREKATNDETRWPHNNRTSAHRLTNKVKRRLPTFALLQRTRASFWLRV